MSDNVNYKQLQKRRNRKVFRKKNEEAESVKPKANSKILKQEELLKGSFSGAVFDPPDKACALSSVKSKISFAVVLCMYISAWL